MGVITRRDESWLEFLSNRVTVDLRTVQRGVMEDSIAHDMWVPNFFLFQASMRRNSLVIPEDPKAINIVDAASISNVHSDIMSDLPTLHQDSKSDLEFWAHVLLVADFDADAGQKLLTTAIEAHDARAGIELVLLHNPAGDRISSGVSALLHEALVKGQGKSIEDQKQLIKDVLTSTATPSEAAARRAAAYWHSTQRLANALDLKAGAAGLWVNGRLLALEDSQSLSGEDLDMLLKYERTKRVTAIAGAIDDLSLRAHIKNPLDLAKITSLIARTQISDVPEGLFESAPLVRLDRFKSWNSSYTCIKTSTSDDPMIKLVASIDPVSEIAQQWLPILSTFSKMYGVELQIFVNPRERLQELPVKRFYRHVIDSEPKFESDGSLITPKAVFSGIPTESLLNLGMDVPPAWLVAPAECEYDLENIKLSSLPDGRNIEAVYELEHILIEGHSRDVTLGPPPRGAQLMLGTEVEPHFTDTLVMANLGYFQFKANPGIWQISLKPGRSSKIFTIDSAGAKGYAARPGDESAGVALLSFQGKTLFPRLSRNAGMEEEDVLETSKLDSAKDFLNRGASFLSLVGRSKQSTSEHADINIFSVASGHLYERMLNIMMISVMHHTKHSVKFWFVEQFLSPSFKSFLPHMSAAYGFDYEMVTFKWPHWLRGQKEKQREIWGYKILFLDVLFPLSLDKVIFVDADQIVLTDMMELNKVDLQGAPYGFTPMCDSRTEMEGFRFWKQGYWQNYLDGKPYHISALYVVDLKKFRELAAGDRLRQQYQALSADPASLSNLDQDLPNHMQHNLPIFSLPQEWLWCETWCSDESKAKAKTIDLCNNPQTKEPKLDRARRQVPQWTDYDNEVAALARRVKEEEVSASVVLNGAAQEDQETCARSTSFDEVRIVQIDM